MNLAVLNKVCRIALLALVMTVVLWIGYVTSDYLPPKTQGALLSAFTAIFIISEAFFWKAIDNVGEILKSDAINAPEASALLIRLKTIKGRMIQRWFILLALKILSGACAAMFLSALNFSWILQSALWTIGISALALSLPIALTFFHIWQQADNYKAQQVVEAKRKKEQRETQNELNKELMNSLNADKALEGYTQLVTTPWRGRKKL